MLFAEATSAVTEHQQVKREARRNLKQSEKEDGKEVTDELSVRWLDAVPVFAQAAHPTPATRQGVDQLTVNETLLGRRLGTFDESTQLLDHSQLSAAQHAKAERIVLEIEAFDEKYSQRISDDMREEVDDYRSSPAEPSSSVFSVGPPPGFDDLGSDAPMASPASGGGQHELPALVSIAGVPISAITDVTSESTERAAASPGAAQQFSGDGGSGGGGSGTDDVNSVVSPTPTLKHTRKTKMLAARVKRAAKPAATPGRASTPVVVPTFWRALSGVIVMLGLARMLGLGFTTPTGNEVRCITTVYKYA